MDLLFSKYASPFLFVDLMISNGRFSDSIDAIWEAENEKRNWEFFLHKVHGISYSEFLDSINGNRSEPVEPLETTVKNSAEILSGFIPETKRGE